MERIVLEVDDSVGKTYRSFSEKSKRQFSEMISIMVKKAANDATHAEYSKLLDDMGTEALKNGLTAEILEMLLTSDD